MSITSRGGDTHKLQSACQPSQHAHTLMSREGDTHQLQSTRQSSQYPHTHNELRGRDSLAAECMPTQLVSSCPLQAEGETLTNCRVHANPVSIPMPVMN